MPTLDWIGKKAVLNHHREVPYHLLRCDKKLSVGDVGSGNLLVEGDNLVALKALLPYYAGQVKCIYIDPPYNTGNEGWAYNDNVNSREIRKWLGKVVGKEAEDLSRHDKWLCMMYPRLLLLKEFLCQDGIIFVSIDRHEFADCRLLLDEIFGVRNYISTLVWKSRHFVDARPTNGVSEDHEYVMVYGRQQGARLRGKQKDFGKYKNPDNDPRGPWTSCSLLGKATAEQRPNLHYDFVDPLTGQEFDCPERTGWICARETMEFNSRDKRLLYPKKKDGRLRVKVFQKELKSDFMGFPSVITEFSTSDGTVELRDILGEQVFSFPKPSDLLATLIEQVTDHDSIVMDSFAGSGTTGHATAKVNARDDGSRRFLLIEMDSDICRLITQKRLRTIASEKGFDSTAKSLLHEKRLTVKRVEQGHKLIEELDEAEVEHSNEYEEFSREIVGDKLCLFGTRKEPASGLSGGFRYCTLSSSLFDEAGMIQADVKFSDLAAHVFFTETGEPIPKRATGKTPFIGECDGKAYYLLFNGILGDKRPNGGNVLTGRTLELIRTARPSPDPSLRGRGGNKSGPSLRGKGVKKDGPSLQENGVTPCVIYGEGCRLGAARLKREGIVFKQVPYEIKVS